MKKAFFLSIALWCSITLNGASVSVSTTNCSLESADSGTTFCAVNFHSGTESEKSGTFFAKKSEKRITKIFTKAANRAGEAVDEDKRSLNALHLGITSTILMILGYLSLIVLSAGIMFLLFAILSMITGISAISKAKKVLKNKENTLRFRNRAIIGLTLGIIGLTLSALPYITGILSYLTSGQ